MSEPNQMSTPMEDVFQDQVPLDHGNPFGPARQGNPDPRDISREEFVDSNSSHGPINPGTPIHPGTTAPTPPSEGLTPDIPTPATGSETERDILARLLTGVQDMRLIAPPPRYKGERRGNAARNWIRRFLIYLDSLFVLGKRDLRGDKNAMILLATNCFENDAAQWWEALRDPLQGLTAIPDWATFEKYFLAHFSDVRTDTLRRDAFNRLTQTHSVHAFYTKVRNEALYVEPRPGDQGMMDVFRRGLKPHVRDRIQAIPDSLIPTTFEEYAAFAMKAELEQAANRHPTPTFTSGQLRHTTGSHSSVSTPAVDHDGDVAMTMNAIQKSGFRKSSTPKKMPPKPQPGSSLSKSRSTNRETPKPPRSDYLQQCRDNNLCFACGQSGHVKRDCTRRPQKQGKGRHR
jgi:Retrotransposon gag protein/Zinc knuckle